ncbi:type IV secretion system protein [Bartonella sp. B41]
MKKLITTVAMAVISVVLAKPSLASEVESIKDIDFSRLGGGYGTYSGEYRKPDDETYEVQLDAIEKQLEELKKIREAITGHQTANGAQTGQKSLFLKNPQSIYDANRQKEIADRIPQIVKQLTMKENELLSSVNNARQSISARSEYATIMNKAISLQAFEETKNRYDELLELLGKINQVQDLKGFAELQTHINARLALIQNEATKLQMVAHQSNTEQALINRLTSNRNMRILSKNNQKMPNIRYAR